MKGPGKYDEQSMHVLLETQAEAALVIVLGGNRGSGFSASMLAGSRAKFRALVPDILREAAREIEADIEGPPMQ